MTSVACVKAGTKYGPEYVWRLYKAVRITGGLKDLPFICFTDDASNLPPGVIVSPLRPEPRGWWHKVYLFNWEEHGHLDRLLYLDLDMVITGPLVELAEYDGPFLTAARFNDATKLGSTVMSIPPGFGQDIWNTFIRNPEYPMTRDKYAAEGDQRFIQGRTGNISVKLQNLYPGYLASYKIHCRDRGLPPGTRLVSFHGRPNPIDVRDEWVLRCWTRIWS